MKTLDYEIRSSETLWYPACGNDLRPVHHVAFNNLYIDPRWIIMNDVNPNLDMSPLEKIEGISVHASINREFEGVTVQLIKVFIEVNGRKKMKNIIYFPLTNRDTYALLVRKRIYPKTALLHQVNDAFEGMEQGWLQSFRQLQVKYCYTDNWFALSLRDEISFRKRLQQQGIRYISKQSYSGFRFTNPNDYLNTRLAINNCFDSTIHLFEI